MAETITGFATLSASDLSTEYISKDPMVAAALTILLTVAYEPPLYDTK